MYSYLSSGQKDLFQSEPWGVEMTITPTSGSVLNVTDANIVMGSLTVDRYVSTGSGLPIGTATAGQLSFTLDNANHDFDGVIFAGASIYLRFYVIDPSDNSYVYLPVGYFTVDEAPRILRSISIVALDAMVQFDVIPELTVAFPCTVQALVDNLAYVCGITLHTTLTNLPNYGYLIPSAPEQMQDLTARQLLQYCCQIMGCNAQIGRDGELYLLEYSNTPSDSFDEKKRYSSDIREDITITGVQISSTTGDVAITGNEGYVLEIKDNPLIQTDPTVLLSDLYYLCDLDDPIVFAPFSAVVVPVPWYDPMDVVTFTKGGEGHTVFCTKVQQTINANTALEGTGLSETIKGFATIDPLTVREQQILRDIRTRASEAVSAAEQNAISFSNIIANSLGLYDLSVENLDGSTTYYFGDKSTLEDSNTIYTFRADGFAWTDHAGYLIDDWHYGINSNGNAMLRLLTLYKLTADQIEASSITAKELNLTLNDTLFGDQTVTEVINNNGVVTQTQGKANANEAEINRQAKYIKIGDLSSVQNADLYGLGKYGVAVGRVDDNNNFIAYSSFTQNKLSFYDEYGTDVAYISSATLHIRNAEIIESIKFGHRFTLNINTDSTDTDQITGWGSLTLRW